MKRFIWLSITIATGIARDQNQRRRAMFTLTLVALVMFFVGMVPFWKFFTEHPLFFAIYWLACVWLVLCVLLLAIYDLSTVLRRGREEYAKARKDILEDEID